MQYVLFLMVILLAVLPLQLRAASTDWDVNEQARTRLVAAKDSVAPDHDVIRIGWQVDLAPGWKTYWRAPGEAGLPPRFDWSGSGNVAAVDVAWPTPERMTAYGFDSIVYDENVVLPITVRLSDPGQSVSLQLKVNYMVCEEICIPLEARHHLTLAAGTGEPAAEADLIDSFEARVPPRQPEPGSTEVYRGNGPWLRDISLSADGLDLRVSGGAVGIADIFHDAPPSLALGRAEDRGKGPDGLIRLHIPVYGGDPKILSDQELGLVLLDGSGQAVEWRGHVSEVQASCTSGNDTKAVDRACTNR
jgi:suppressor for copper-sensitivity B